MPKSVIPAEAGIQRGRAITYELWARCAGMATRLHGSDETQGFAGGRVTLLWIAALVLTSLSCNKKIPEYPSPETLPSDAPWELFLKEHHLTPRAAPGWEKALLSYQLRPECPLVYQVALSAEVRSATGQAPTSLPQRQDSLAMFQIESTQEGALFSSARSSLPVESAPGVLLDHFWEKQVKVPLSISPQQLKTNAAPRAPWIDLIHAPGASLFFPILTGERTTLGQRWRALQEINANPQPEPAPWMPWKNQDPTTFVLEDIYSIHGERVALITAQWTKYGAWSKDALSPFYQATESGTATYLWLADRGWPLLAEVFVTVSLDTTALDTPAQSYSYTLVGRSSLVESCQGLLIDGD